MEENKKKCILCRKGKDNLDHYIENCEITRDWFVEMGYNKEEIKEWICNDRLDEKKEKILRRIWKTKDRKIKELKEKEWKEGNEIDTVY